MDTPVVAKHKALFSIAIKYLHNIPSMMYIVEYKLKLVACYLINHKKFNCSTFFIVNYQNFCLATLALYFQHFIKKELSDYPVDAIRMAVCFLYSYIDINLKILKCPVKRRLMDFDF
jgi:hypothetical protein